jgi:signal peptidase I
MSKRSRALRYYRSYKPQSPLSKLLRTLLRLVLVLFLAYHLISVFLLRSYRVDTAAAEPNIERHDTLLASPLLYGPSLPFVDSELPALRSPRRGELVIRNNRPAPRGGVAVRLADPLLRFFTLQRLTLQPEPPSGLFPGRSVLRVVGLPGDTVKMEGYTVYVRPAGSSSFIPERELAGRTYPLTIPPADPGAGEEGEIPFDGNQPPLELSEGEYLLLPDNRRFAAAARVWRPSPASRITDKVMVRYWPQFTRF